MSIFGMFLLMILAFTGFDSIALNSFRGVLLILSISLSGTCIAIFQLVSLVVLWSQISEAGFVMGIVGGLGNAGLGLTGLIIINTV